MQAAYWDPEIARWRPLGLAFGRGGAHPGPAAWRCGRRPNPRCKLPECAPPVIRNQLLPWEAEALLRALGWDVPDQFPSSAPSVAGVANPYTPEMAARPADRLLQQTVASSRWFVTAKPANA
jgi:hypothetical protein